LEERVFSEPAVKEVLERFVCVRLDGRESAENRALKLEYGPVVMGNVQNRIVSPEGENLARLPTDWDIPRLVDYLERWLALYPGTEEPSGLQRPLPYFATLHQALNVAACDARVLAVVVTPATDRLEELLAPLAWDPEFAGRLHFVRADREDVRLDRIRGLAADSGVAYLVLPDEFGMAGELAAQFWPETPPEDVREAALTALQRHESQFVPRTVVEKFQRHGKRGESDWYYLVAT
jgi:hypothetical protein